MRTVILFRDSLAEQGERNIAAKHFTICRTRSTVPAGCRVVGRYSVLPYYDELAQDLEYGGSRLINSPAQHRYLTDLGNWYRDLRVLTFPTWVNIQDIPSSEEGPFVVKGATNSKKSLWNTHMFAADRAALPSVIERLEQDGLVGEQGLYIRKFEPLHTYFTGPRGLPITKEFRVFICGEHILTRAFYWAGNLDEVTSKMGVAPNPEDVPERFIHKIMRRVGRNATFYTADIAQRADGSWVLVELNDGQMSGLSATNPAELYSHLATAVQHLPHPHHRQTTQLGTD